MFHWNDPTASTERDVLVRNVDRKSILYTDASRLYTRTGEEYASHKTTNHAQGEYVRYEGDETIHSNTIENVFSVFKRGMIGVYQHCGEAHCITTLPSSISVTIAVPVSRSPTPSATTSCLPRSKASASPIGGLVRPITPKQKARMLQKKRKKV